MSTVRRKHQPHDSTTGRFKKCRRALTTEQVATLAFRWNAGDNQVELSAEYGLSRTTARRLADTFLRTRTPTPRPSYEVIHRTEPLPYVASYSVTSEPLCFMCGQPAAENLGTARFVEVDAALRPICPSCRGDTPTVGFSLRYREPGDQHFHM